MAKIVDDIEPSANWIASALTSSGYQADFTLTSLREIDRFFDEHAVSGEARPNGLLNKDLGMRLFSLGAYTGEVIRRAVGGRWHGDDLDPAAEINVTLELLDNQRIWPVQRVMKRFQNGHEDLLEHYGRVITQNA